MLRSQSLLRKGRERLPGIAQITPRAFARLLPSPVRARISSRSNSANPPSTVSINSCGDDACDLERVQDRPNLYRVHTPPRAVRTLRSLSLAAMALCFDCRTNLWAPDPVNVSWRIGLPIPAPRAVYRRYRNVH